MTQNYNGLQWVTMTHCNHCGYNGVITHLEPDILACKVKWALGSVTANKVSGGDGIPVELFHILKDDAVKVLTSIYQQIWGTQQWPQDWRRSVFIPILKKGNAKNVQTTAQLHSFHKLASSVQSLSCIPLSETPLTAALQASLSIIHSWSYPSPTPGAVHHQLPELAQTHVH